VTWPGTPGSTRWRSSSSATATAALDRQQLARFLDGFQTVAPLTIGELWAWPSMLKLALHREPAKAVGGDDGGARGAACRNGYVERIDAAGTGAVPPLPRTLHAAHVVHCSTASASSARAWRLSGATSTRTWPGAVTRPRRRSAASTSAEAATQVSVANAITSLRLCAEIDWPQFVESVSLVERVLQRDPAGVHGRMDFLSRIATGKREELAEPSGEAQVRVALRAVESGREAAEAEGQGARAAHGRSPSIGKGRRGLEADVAWRPGFWKGLRRLAFAHAAFLYLAAVSLATAGLVAAGVAYARTGGASPRALVVTALLLLLPASEFAIALIQRLAAHVAPPRRLPRLDFEEGFPRTHGPLVVIPTLARERARGGGPPLAPRGSRAREPRPAHPLRHPGDFTDAGAQELPGRRSHPRGPPAEESRRSTPGSARARENRFFLLPPGAGHLLFLGFVVGWLFGLLGCWGGWGFFGLVGCVEPGEGV